MDNSSNKYDVPYTWTIMDIKKKSLKDFPSGSWGYDFNSKLEFNGVIL